MDTRDEASSKLFRLKGRPTTHDSHSLHESQWPTAARCGRLPIRRAWACASRVRKGKHVRLRPQPRAGNIENSSSDDRDDFWAELVDLMARKGKGKGKNKIKQVNYHDVGVQTDFDANQIFCEIDNALLHLASVTTEAQAQAAAPLQALPPATAVDQQRALDADEHLQDLRMRVEHMPQLTMAPSVLRRWTVEPPSSASSSRPSRPPLRAPPSPHRERSRSREVYRNPRATISSRGRWGTSSSGGEGMSSSGCE